MEFKNQLILKHSNVLLRIYFFALVVYHYFEVHLKGGNMITKRFFCFTLKNTVILVSNHILVQKLCKFSPYTKMKYLFITSFQFYYQFSHLFTSKGEGGSFGENTRRAITGRKRGALKGVLSTF